MADVALDSISLLYLERKEMVAILELLSQDVLDEKSITDLLEAPER